MKNSLSLKIPISIEGANEVYNLLKNSDLMPLDILAGFRQMCEFDGSVKITIFTEPSKTY